MAYFERILAAVDTSFVRVRSTARFVIEKRKKTREITVDAHHQKIDF